VFIIHKRSHVLLNKFYNVCAEALANVVSWCFCVDSYSIASLELVAAIELNKICLRELQGLHLIAWKPTFFLKLRCSQPATPPFWRCLRQVHEGYEWQIVHSELHGNIRLRFVWSKKHFERCASSRCVKLATLLLRF